ncbi:hypothetical protein N0V90_005910 [Kalmusia sp. IMI 367209]|nr:hypothetical protein N0V90_005910 [Kalmusia sp. IMI 367209]
MQTESLDALSYVYGVSYLDLGLPSFVPDWTAIIAEAWHKSLLHRCSYLAQFNACRGSRAEFMFIPPSEASTRAVLVDEIVEKEYLVYTDWKQVVDECHRISRSTNDSESPYLSKASAFWKTMCGGMMTSEAAEMRVRRVEDTDFSSYECWKAWIDSGLSPSLLLPVVDDFQEPFSAVTAGRSFIRTKKGYIGFVSEKSTKGNLIAVFPGGKVPYVLRPRARVEDMVAVTNNNRRFTFLGDAYVHGIMDGESYEETKLETITLFQAALDIIKDYYAKKADVVSQIKNDKTPAQQLKTLNLDETKEQEPSSDTPETEKQEQE